MMGPRATMMSSLETRWADLRIRVMTSSRVCRDLLVRLEGLVPLVLPVLLAVLIALARLVPPVRLHRLVVLTVRTIPTARTRLRLLTLLRLSIVGLRRLPSRAISG